MEVSVLNNENYTQKQSNASPFIEGNSIASSLEEIKKDHIIPVYRDNQPAISQGDFIEILRDAAAECFSGVMLPPVVRVSHPIKGRVPAAKSKTAEELLDHERTLYYERMAFVIEFPAIEHVVDGNPLSLSVGGIKAFNLDRFHNKKGVDEHFKVFAGFKNQVCTNLCLSSDGFADNLTARSMNELQGKVLELFRQYNFENHISELSGFSSYTISESELAHLLGRCRLYNFLSNEQKKQIPTLKLNDTQLTKVAELFYRDPNFRMQNGEISLWSLYNLFTSSIKNSYPDLFLDRGANAHDFVQELVTSLKHQKDCWFLN